MYDITAEAVSNTAVLHLKNARGEHMYVGEGEERRKVEIVLYGPGSPQYAEVEARQTARAVKRMQENDNKVSLPSPEQAALERAEDLATLTVEFRNFNYPPAGNALGAELYFAVYADKRLGFIPPQVRKFVDDWGNFKGASQKS
ncbi:hypothetical protein CA223_06835 [Sphingomonas koreensis]|uniref:Uncharacterized protein n=1 Tax=Sphingomonas koreensis TaxID=93064 RepID=A0A1L6J7V0_9SPHN|nr:hypothetical protein [Sphingomonas koreensis]APR51988.1 hypothetical protein BRX40_05645 [Sphingomonas koreensis]RSU22790.1 hypothetical protein CA224_05265 [Sphingomonas koreensis]RSU30736.1 hypothetical protein CA222_01280 [Sphingomonas koreensis]RSU31831.1 hypothetical protein CA225_00360 [Sphingomonas koreensis]RSU39248.1 hypothetical protein BRX39_01170 [Sphingomonas koreensis]